MLVRGERKEFVEPMLNKCEEPLDKVTMQVYGGNNTSSHSGSECDWFENLFNLDGCN